MGAIENVLKLQQEFEKAKGTAIQELLDNRAKIDDQLKALGYGVVEKVKSATGIKRQRDPNKPCPICGKTGHDGRFHRKDKKKAAKPAEAKK